MQSNLINRYYLIVLLSLFFLVSCEEKIDSTLQSDANKLIVVEGIITNQMNQFQIKLSQSVAEINDVSLPVSGATVQILIDTQRVKMFEDSINPGIYKTKTNHRAVINEHYTLEISYQGVLYTATTQMIPITDFDLVTYFESSQNQNVYEISENFYSKENAMWELTYDWDFNGDCDTCKAKAYYYTIHSLDVSEIFSPTKQKIYFPIGTKIIQKKYSLSDDHAAFIREFLLETQWNGWYFDENPAQVKGNLSNGAVGFFGACMVLVDTLVVK